MSHTLLTAKNVSYELPLRTLFKDVSLSVTAGDRIGFVGQNGAGKSTLLRILSGEIVSSLGVVERNARTYYMPQLEPSLFENPKTIGEFLAEREASWPLARASLQKLFAIDWLTAEKEVRTLSGGELAKLLIATCDSTHPELLLLDEPTNHLDVDGLEVLKEFLLTFPGAFIAVSHDPLFLDHVATTIWEFENGELSVYGGNYSFYEEQKLLAEASRERNLEIAERGVKKAESALRAEETRIVRATREGKRAKAEPSRDKFLEGFFGNRAGRTGGKVKERLNQDLEDRKQKVTEFAPGARRGKAHVKLQVDSDLSKRLLVRVTDGVLTIDDRALLSGVEIRIALGDRLVITGGNGSGKSSFVKALIGLPGPYVLEGEVRRAETFRAVYMDQKYQILNPKLSLLENMEAANPQLERDEVRQKLGQFLFSDESTMKKPAGVLSGGEVARLSLALVTASPIDLLVLDEPTNNLDIGTLEIIASALQNFSGALIVVSHNVHFLAGLDIEKAYHLGKGMLKEMKYLPEEQEDFYHELVSSTR